MPPIFTLIAARILGCVGLGALSFWLTLHGMEYFQSPLEPIRSKVILTFGEASASAIYLTKDTKFEFRNGYAEIQDTKELQCRKFKCNFSLAVTFAPIASNTQLIIGQSFLGDASWHLLWHVGRLLLRTEDGAVELAAPFNPTPGQRYKIDIAQSEREVSLSVDGIVVAKSTSVPFTDLARNLTIGGRAGPITLALAGSITDLHIARHRLGH